MSTIYISSTFADLKDFRDKSINALRKAGHHIVAMEDYVATGKYTPLKKCLDDVANCDYYVGIFAWRYGYVPIEDNPTQKAITELEYRKACETDKPRFIFLLHPDADWPLKFVDSHTGESKAGECIKALRDELGKDKVVSFFKTSDELSSLVVAAINNWGIDEQQRQIQRYVESEYIEEITSNSQHIESLNTSLKFAQEMQNTKTLSEEQAIRFKQLKREAWEVANLNDRFKELDQKALSLVSEIRARLDQEGQTLAREIAQHGRENIDLKRIESYEKLNTIISKFERELERGRQVAQWIKKRHPELVNDSIQASLKALKEEPALLQQLERPEQHSILQREVEQYLRRIAVALTLGRTNLLDDANGLNEFPKILYKTIFESIKVRKVQTSSSLLQTEKDLLIFYIDHLIDHVFVEF
jgi:hypothetical protein